MSVVPSGVAARLYCILWISPPIFQGLGTSSGFNLMFLSIERYLAITKPLSYDEHRIKRRLPVLIPAIWISGLICMLPDPIYFKVVDGACIYTGGTLPQRDILLMFSYYAFMGFVIPGVTMLVLYTHMGVVLWRSQQLQKQMTSQGAKKNDLLGKAQVNIFFTCLTLLVLFLTCWVLNRVSTMLFFAHVVLSNRILFDVSSMLIVLNSVVNPFIYTIRYDELQLHLKMLLFGRKPANNSHTSYINQSMSMA